MGNLSYATGNSANWEFLWTANLEAPPLPAPNGGLERYYPLEPQSVPFLLDSELVAIHATSSTAEENWHYAGTIDQHITTGITVGGGVDAVTAKRKFYLNQITLLRFPIEYGSSYGLVLRIPYWIRQITINLWHYTGPITDTYTTKLDQLILNTTP